ncbi:MAG: hypothetical protein ACD_60C00079G0007 [uncultured bacterium]|nr:MAG: hypothetical protein ACD_60C00079G0007 [uncultured bacterium]
MVTLKQQNLPLVKDSIDINSWLNDIRHRYQLRDTDLIQKSMEFAEIHSKGLTTFYGQSCLEQSLTMADILLDMQLDQTAVAASIITSTLQHTSISIETIKETLGERTAKLAASVMQMNALDKLSNKTRNKMQVDLLRKLFLAMVSDIRVVLIKLAERICIMRGIKHVNPRERKRIAEETMDIYAPLANRLGIGQLKWELEDHAFHYLDPDTYKTIADFLAERRIDREERIQTTLHFLKEKLNHAGIKADIAGRAKHIYSIYLKSLKKNLNYRDIYDCSAVRILVPTVQDCYLALSIVHQIFEHLTEEFDDYISHPKQNGYRSIHTAVIGSDGKYLEVQIRTPEMHEFAEHGVAAHWVYKETKTPESGYEAKITFLRQLLLWHKEMAALGAVVDKKMEFLEENIYVFTPTGDIIDLPRGATPLDFAYRIHSDVGHQCKGAKIKGHIVPLTYGLQTGDQVEIITTPKGTPSRDWLHKELGYLKTSRARAKVAHWFKQQDIDSSSEGSKSLKTTPLSILSEENLPIIPFKTSISTASGLQIAGIHDVLTRIAKCCKPIPDDAIIGYITQGRGVTIHRENCNNIPKERNNRLVNVAWDSEKRAAYSVDLKIRAYGQQHLLKDMTALLANAKIDLVALNSTINKTTKMLSVIMTIQIYDAGQLKQITDQFNQLPHVIEVKRMSAS